MIMNKVFILIYLVWFLSEVILGRLLRSKKGDKKNADKGSLVLIWVIIIIANISAVLMSIWFPFSISKFFGIGYVGLAVILLGIILRLSIIVSLGKFFTVNVTIKEDHQLKTDGFYKYLRHPSYFASLISFIGFGISLNNWISLAIVFILVLFAFSVRVRVEEKVLIEYFGDTYIDYIKNTKGIIPFVC